jgi:hypothetical protein
MKTCDVCGRNDRDGKIEFGGVSSLFIGTTIDTFPVAVSAEDTYGFATPCELCGDCIEKVNRSLAGHLESEFGLVIRR